MDSLRSIRDCKNNVRDRNVQSHIIGLPERKEMDLNKLKKLNKIPNVYGWQRKLLAKCIPIVY